MEVTKNMFDAIVIGGGFYGTVIALYLKQKRNLNRILLIEKEAKLLQRASYNNQARVHNGYHYPRSFTTAYRSRINLPQFIHHWPDAIKKDFVKLYAIARRNSKVTARQFERFCHEIGAKIQPADSSFKKLFEPKLIEEVFLVKEYVFNAAKLTHWTEYELKKSGIKTLLQTQVTKIFKTEKSQTKETNLGIIVQQKNTKVEKITCRYLFNCTYSGLNQLGGDFPGTQATLKQEVAEMALIQVPECLQNLGITVMDGSFFSIMPFPARGLHTLSHVRYTPHFSWQDERGIDPYQKLKNYDCATRVDRMLRDSGRYLPSILEAKYIDSLFEIKTVLVKNEGDDGRPILFEKYVNLPGCYSVLGGKIDNIYDILEKLDAELLEC